MGCNLRSLEDEYYLYVKREIEKLASRIGLKLEEQTKYVIEGNNLKVSGWLKDSISHEAIERSTKATLSYMVKIFGNVKYAVYVHEGTKPHYPKLSAIREWVVRKGIAKRVITKGKNKGNKVAIHRPSGGVRALKSMDEYWTVDQAARSIAWSIYRKGTKGVRFFDIALKQAEPAILRMVDKL